MADNTQEQSLKWKKRCFMVWAVIGAAIIFVGILKVCGILWQTCAVIAVGAAVAFILHSPVNYFEKKGLSRFMGTVISFVLMLVVVALFCLVLFPPLVEQATSLANNAPIYVKDGWNAAQETYRNFVSNPANQNEFIDDIVKQATSWVTDNAGTFASKIANGVFIGVVGVGTGFFIVFMGMFIAFWILLELPKLGKEIRVLVGPSRQHHIDVLSNTIGGAFYGWLKATSACAFVNAVIVGAVMYFMGIPYAVLGGVMCGLMFFVPYIGPVIAAIVVGAMGLLVSPLFAVIAIALETVVCNVIANFISPLLMKNSANVHPIITVLALISGGALGGMIGMLLAIPIAAAIQGLLIAYYEHRTGREIATPDGVLLAAKPKDDDEEEQTEEGANANTGE